VPARSVNGGGRTFEYGQPIVRVFAGLEDPSLDKDLAELGEERAELDEQRDKLGEVEQMTRAVKLPGTSRTELMERRARSNTGYC